MTLVGEFSCYWREQREINLPSTSKLSTKKSPTPTSSLPKEKEEDMDDEEMIDASTTERTAFIQKEKE